MNFGLNVDTDWVNNRMNAHNTDDKSSAFKIFSSTTAARCNIKGAYIASVDSKPTFTMKDVLGCFQPLQADKIKSFKIVFAPELGLSAHEQRRIDYEHQWFTPEHCVIPERNFQGWGV